MKTYAEIMYWILLLLLLFILLQIIGGLVFNIFYPGIKGMGDGVYEMLGILFISIYGLFSLFSFLRK